MNNKLFLALFTLILACGFSSLTFASGGGSYGGSGSSEPIRAVDQDYEFGKSIFQGRQAGVARYSYCIEIENTDGTSSKKPLKRSLLKQFSGQNYSAVSQKLYDCKNPENLIINEIGANRMEYVMYYLSKRYKLGLNQR